MDADRFDELLRLVASSASRRSVLLGLASGAISLALADGSRLAIAKKGKKKLKFNEFGCVDVGGKCRGNKDHCCSGICEGDKPKKGKKDKSRCVAHDVGSCQDGQETCGATDGSCTTSTGFKGTCGRTTGNALYCHSVTGPCQACSKDVDCVSTHGAGAACVIAILDYGIPCSGGCEGNTGPSCRGNAGD
jgi:hypothetical protein